MTAPRAQGHGFTLIEILVVLLLMGLMVAMVSVSFGGPSDGKLVDKEADAWQARFALMHDEAIMRSEELGLKFDGKGGVEVMRFDPDAPVPGTEDDPDGPKGAWVDLNDDNVLKNWQSQPGIHGSLVLDGLSLGESLIPDDAFTSGDDDNRANQDSKDGKDKRLTPHLFFLSSGEFMPFELCLYKVHSSLLDGLFDSQRQSRERALLASGDPDAVVATCIDGHANGTLSQPQDPDMDWSKGEVKW
ncbi:MAG: prepilin-type N-terminal cleavage/methylation domain-containing protein [Pseudomonadota bacterium]|uniref:prepilin-type N-terminal cleavage/methylation domain-containing protein n=1 Tax=Gallaecimonas pentaromativorans TaxID=584787 RepID=UPI00067F0595|nr:prepilin-type N-terminal cleavage/methylation domain-containing protein [Gallaecimonas pentaromativorans]MED5526041.1 prepilin-type N-terminal cleavage/methylation domain-containing protein [Pseudomonadota bacterium]